MKAERFLCACALLLDFQLALGQQEECPNTSELSMDDQILMDLIARCVKDIASAFSRSRNASETDKVNSTLTQALQFLSTSDTLRNWLEKTTYEEVDYAYCGTDYFDSEPVTTKGQIHRMFEDTTHLEKRVLSANVLLDKSREMMRAFQDMNNALNREDKRAADYFLVFATVFASVGDFILTHEQGLGYEPRLEADFAQLTHLLERYSKARWTGRLASIDDEIRKNCKSNLGVANSLPRNPMCGMSKKCFHNYIGQEQRKYFDVLDAVQQLLRPKCGNNARGEPTANVHTLLRTPKCSSVATTQPDLCKCGQSDVTRIFPGRTVAREGEIPWRAYVSIHRMTLRGQVKASCTGTILSPGWVLTAAHCFGPSAMDVTFVEIMAGSASLDHSQRFQAASIFVHKSFTYTKEPRKDDIALVKLRQDLPFGPTISPACLPHNWTSTSEYSGRFLASGWGSTLENAKWYDILHKAEPNVLTDEHCERHNRPIYVQSTHICTHTRDSDYCMKASGRNMDYLNGGNGKYYVVGVESRCSTGTTRKPNTMVQYTRISEYIPWIEHHTGTRFCKN